MWTSGDKPRLTEHGRALTMVMSLVLGVVVAVIIFWLTWALFRQLQKTMDRVTALVIASSTAFMLCWTPILLSGVCGMNNTLMPRTSMIATIVLVGFYAVAVFSQEV